MSRTFRCIVGCLVALTSLPFMMACMWDLDTIAMERTRFPSALELITGKFIRHSEAYYHWRVDDRLERLEQKGNDLELLDDLAVAYDKLGQHPLAIETLLKSLQLEPNRYEGLANLGTFYIHAGELERGLGYIQQAIAINPEAHFGREVYQQLLVEYVLKRRSERPDGPLLPLRNGEKDFAEFLFRRKQIGFYDQPDEAASAVKGVLGMMRFGDWKSPILLEALGDLLLAADNTGTPTDAKHLAATADL